MCVCVHMCVPVYVCVRTRACVCMCACTCIHACIYYYQVVGVVSEAKANDRGLFKIQLYIHIMHERMHIQDGIQALHPDSD